MSRIPRSWQECPGYRELQSQVSLPEPLSPVKGLTARNEKRMATSESPKLYSNIPATRKAASAHNPIVARQCEKLSTGFFRRILKRSLVIRIHIANQKRRAG